MPRHRSSTQKVVRRVHPPHHHHSPPPVPPSHPPCPFFIAIGLLLSPTNPSPVLHHHTIEHLGAATSCFSALAPTPADTPKSAVAPRARSPPASPAPLSASLAAVAPGRVPRSRARAPPSPPPITGPVGDHLLHPFKGLRLTSFKSIHSSILNRHINVPIPS
uniref:Uncharacterized protein n=1 Tax=Oryza meridionalis TaxID=40149 RepID=A0A0E0DTK6_9ORYZ